MSEMYLFCIVTFKFPQVLIVVNYFSDVREIERFIHMFKEFNSCLDFKKSTAVNGKLCHMLPL
jgi:hypothetical protein